MRSTPIQVNIGRIHVTPEGYRPRYEYPFTHAWRPCGDLEWVTVEGARMHPHIPEAPLAGTRYWMTSYRIPLPEITPETTGTQHCVEITAGSVDTDGTVYHLGHSIQTRVIPVPEPALLVGLLIGIVLLVGLRIWSQRTRR